MGRRVHTEVLRYKYKALGYYADELYDAKTDFEFFYSVSVYIVPLLLTANAFEKFYFRYIKEKDARLKLQAGLRDKVPEEIDQAFFTLNQDLKIRLFFNNSDIREMVDDIAQVLNHKNRYGIPSYIDVAHEKIRYLLEAILLLGDVSFVQKYAVVAYRRSIDLSTMKEIERPYINRFIFAPSVDKLHELEQHRGEHCLYFWIAWEYLFLLEWCWHTPANFFDEIVESYDDYQSRNRSIDFVLLRSYWFEVQDVKKQVDKQFSGNFFSKAKLMEAVKTIINNVILEQESNSTRFQNSSEENLDINEPYFVKLRLDDINLQLLLDVQWYKDSGTHIYIVHNNFRDGSGAHKFIRAVFASPQQRVYLTEELTGVSGGTVAKYFDYFGLNNILGKIFFNERKTHSVVMKKQSVYGSDLSREEKTELKDFIRNKLSPYLPIKKIM